MTALDQHRPRLFALAYRMLGSVADAEDVVQETFMRWQQAEAYAVRSPEAYLSTVCTRLCIDHLRSARVQRERYVGPWLPEPLVTDPGPAQQAAQAQSLSVAFLVLLESLSPVERAVYLLHDVFDYDFEEVAQMVGKRADNCRQIATRARRHLAAHRPRFEASAAERDELLDRFLQASRDGDLAALVEMLADEAVLYSDGGGKVAAARKPIHGADRIARFITGIVRKAPPGVAITRRHLNGLPGFIATVAGQPQSTWALDIAEGRIQRLYVVSNPDKLGHVPDAPA